MYETWVKQLIDIVDELAPVTVVRSRLELPLGSVTGDMTTAIHCRLDLTDEDSPWCDLNVQEAGDEVHMAYMIHVPNLNRRTDEEIIANAQSVAGIRDLFLLTPVGRMGQETYVIKGTITVPLNHPTDNPGSATHDIAEQLVRLMQVGGYEAAQGNDRDAEELITWPTE
jgi:hypothetical protein